MKKICLLFFITVLHSQQVQKLQNFTTIKIAKIHYDASVALEIEFSYLSTNVLKCKLTWQGSGQLSLKRIHKERQRYKQLKELRKAKEKLLNKMHSKSISATYSHEHHLFKLYLVNDKQAYNDVYNVNLEIETLRVPEKMIIKWPLGKKTFAVQKLIHSEEIQLSKAKPISFVKLSSNPTFFSTKYPAGSNVEEKVQKDDKKWQIEIEDHTNLRPEKSAVLKIHFN
ncbi:hypothetical protein [Candidatus Uabimicrobium sp. HlEnr_7]|uniref:hypothetical protein n=1 Tax=Candidatus Uabimicrobium helgolandensis TaxID=3095367 RepID=UPI0035577F34